MRDFQEAVDQFAAGRIAGGDPINIGVAGVADVVINVDENFAIADAFADLAEAVEAGAIGGDDAVEFFAVLRLVEQSFGIEKFVFLRDGVLVPDGDFFAGVAKGEGEGDLGANAIAIGAHVADDAKGAVFANDFEDAINDFWIRLH